MMRSKRKLYSLFASKAAINHARLRMGLSALNAQRSNYNLIDFRTCQCGSPSEDLTHYFFSCPLYAAQRQNLLGELEDIIVNFSTIIAVQGESFTQNQLTKKVLDLYLYGNPQLDWDNNVNLFRHIQTYIRNTQRFL